ncbi:MAG: PAS domain-containing protein [Bacteroidetes bacterium]|nr:PAS domain-containing protein [Bacteroidota bacterium]
MHGESYTETNDFLLSLVGNLPSGIITVSLDGYITIINRLAKECLGLKEKINDLIDRNILDLICEIPDFFFSYAGMPG